MENSMKISLLSNPSKFDNITRRTQKRKNTVEEIAEPQIQWNITTEKGVGFTGEMHWS